MEHLKDIMQICEQLQSTNSKKEKEQILKKNENNEYFKKILYYNFNTYITTGISSKKIHKSVDLEPTIRFKSLLDVMDYLKENNTGTDQVIANIHNFMIENTSTVERYTFIEEIFTKSLKLGCDSTTINKVYGKGFIPTFKVMLAEKYFDKPQKVEGKDFTITLKVDGQRCTVLKENGKVSLFSRQGQLIEGCIDVENEVRNIPADNFVLDGELTLLDGSGMASKDQYKQTLKITRKDGEKHGIKLLVFDILELNEFINQDCKTTYQQRRNKLTRLDNDILMTYIEILPVLYSGNDTSKIMELLDQVRATDEEGIMINLNDSMYEFKRTSNLLKCKVMQTCDLEIIGLEEGSGRLIGTLGRINVDYKGFVVGVGSGFSDSDRQYFWNHKDELIGRIVEVQYFEETEDKDKNKSLRFPVFKELREIGKEVSYN